MAGKSYDGATVEVKDGIDPAIKTKLAAIRMEALAGADAVDKLANAISRVGSTGLQRLQQQIQQATTAQTALAQAQNAATTATNNGAIAQQRLATEQQRTATAAQKLATEQQRTATETQKTATASGNAATAQQKLSTETNKTATAAQKLSTEQNRTAKEAANAAAAADKAALAAIRLAQAQENAGKKTKTAGDTLLQYAKAAAAAAGAGYGAMAIVKSADEYQNLQNKLQTVATSQTQVNQLTDEMFRLANKTFTPVEATTQAFTRFDRSLKNMGKSQSDTLRMTETINKALFIGGATAQEAAGAMLQLSQAFNSGRLNGDEFRSVSENMPIVLEAVAKVLGKPIAQVKELASQNKITSKVMFDAFKLIEAQVDTTFAKMTPTVERAMTVLKNSFVQWIGQINQSTGFTKALAQGIISLAGNLDTIAKLATIAGAALLTAFGPRLLAAITALGTRVAALWALALANPWVALATVIVGVVTALTMFSDRINVSADGMVTLKDAAGVVFDYIRDTVGTVGDYIKEKWNSAIDWINSKTDGWGEKFRDIGGLIVDAGKATINFIIGGWVGSYDAIKAIWQNFPGLMESFFVNVVNSAATQVERLVNAWQLGARAIGGMLAEIAPESAKALNGFLDKTKIAIPRMQASQKAQVAGPNVSDAFFGALGTDYVGNAGAAFMDAARKRANNRRAEEFRKGEIASRNAAPAGLRGTGPDITGAASGKPDHKAESRAAMLAKVNKQLDDEIARMLKLKPMREDQQKLDAIDEQLIGKKMAIMSGPERSAMEAKIAKIREMIDVQTQMDRIYEEATGPLRDYNATQKAAQKLLDDGVITWRQYVGQVAGATDAFQKATNPLYEITKSLNEQINLSRMMNDEREVEAQVLQVINGALAQKKILDDAEVTTLREKVKLAQEENKLAQEKDRMQGQFSGAQGMKQFGRSMSAIDELSKSDSTFNKSGAADSIMQTMGIDTKGFDIQLQSLLSQQQNFYTQLDKLRQDNLISARDAAAAEFQFKQKVQDADLAYTEGALKVLQGLQTSHSKKMAAIGKAAAIAQTVIDTYKSAQSAYAALAGIPYIGPALGIAAAAAAIAAGMARVSAIRNQGTFMHGGFTGAGQRDKVAGVTHANEFVVNAKATAENRPMLEAMNSGVKAANTNSGGGGGNVAIVQIDFNYDIDISGGGGSGDTSQTQLLQAVDMANKKTQSDIQDSLRYGGTWATLIRQVARG
jgi:tape measure domain-containing protein